MTLPLSTAAVMREVSGRTREVDLILKSLAHALEACRTDVRILALQAMENSGSPMTERQRVADDCGRDFIQAKTIRILRDLDERDRHAALMPPTEATDRPTGRSTGQLDLGL